METVELALDEGADIEAKDIEQWTPLMRGGWWKWKEKYHLMYRLPDTEICGPSGRAISKTLIEKEVYVLKLLGFHGCDV
jgi:hypothetical protein